jgi:hypothetical protein
MGLLPSTYGQRKTLERDETSFESQHYKYRKRNELGDYCNQESNNILNEIGSYSVLVVDVYVSLLFDGIQSFRS